MEIGESGENDEEVVVEVVVMVSLLHESYKTFGGERDERVKREWRIKRGE